MLRRSSSWVTRHTPGWLALLAFLVFLAFTATVLPRQAASAAEAGAGAGSPDTSFFYSPSELVGMAEAYGPAGRQAYVRARFTFDVAWPLVYGLFLLTSISWLGRRGFAPGSRWRLGNLVPLGAVAFDVLENLSTSVVMIRYPLSTPVLAGLAPWFTAVKWILVGVSFLVLGVSACVALVRRLPAGGNTA
ncbi:MAG: hypothetical protein MUO23_15200 [Anaerolineales bacterium]|nr:hypothetical protein [Anaerolineales bacterium]